MTMNAALDSGRRAARELVEGPLRAALSCPSNGLSDVINAGTTADAGRGVGAADVGGAGAARSGARARL